LHGGFAGYATVNYFYFGNPMRAIALAIGAIIAFVSQAIPIGGIFAGRYGQIFANAIKVWIFFGITLVVFAIPIVFANYLWIVSTIHSKNL
jgi:voltage-gated potassium channel Kch